MIPDHPDKDDFNFEKLAREIVMSKLKSLDKPAETAAQVAEKIMVAAVKSTGERQHPMVTIIKVCRGSMSGIVIIDKDLTGAALALLKKVMIVSDQLKLDPESVMTWFLEGIAEVTPMVGSDIRNNIQYKIEEEFLGAGEIFSKLSEQALNRPSSFT